MEFNTQDWQALEIRDVDVLSKPIVLRSQTLPARHIFPLHAHHWHQFIYAISGTLVVTVENTWYVISPEQAIWVPKGQLHTTGALSAAQFRSLCITPVPELVMPEQYTLYSVSPLLRELIIELQRIRRATEAPVYVQQLHGLIYQQLQRLSVQDFHLPWPRSALLRQICQVLHANPADERTIEAWAQALGMSARTLARRFEQEIGISLREWRHRLRIFLAIEWLNSPRSITQIALDLGYASTSAFTYMFRQALGCSPSEWRARLG